MIRDTVTMFFFLKQSQSPNRDSSINATANQSTELRAPKGGGLWEAEEEEKVEMVEMMKIHDEDSH